MTPTMIMFLINLGLELPDLAMKVQRLFMTADPTQEQWDEIWGIMNKLPETYLTEARARMAARVTVPVEV